MWERPSSDPKSGWVWKLLGHANLDNVLTCGFGIWILKLEPCMCKLVVSSESKLLNSWVTVKDRKMEERLECPEKRADLSSRQWQKPARVKSCSCSLILLIHCFLPYDQLSGIRWRAGSWGLGGGTAAVVERETNGLRLIKHFWWKEDFLKYRQALAHLGPFTLIWLEICLEWRLLFMHSTVRSSWTFLKKQCQRLGCKLAAAVAATKHGSVVASLCRSGRFQVPGEQRDSGHWGRETRAGAGQCTERTFASQGQTMFCICK